MCQGSGSLNGPELPSSIMPMITDLDIYRSANVLIKQHGQDAPIETAMRADAILAKGDLDGYAVWRRLQGLPRKRRAGLAVVLAAGGAVS